MKFSSFRGKDAKKIFLVMAAISFAVAIVAIIAISQAVRFFRPKVEEVFSEFKETREKERLERIEKEAWEKEMDIPYSALEYNGHYYYVYDDAESWEDAEWKCEQLGGHLATMTTSSEDKAVYKYVSSKEYEYVFFGLYMDMEQISWNWIITEGTEYANWTEGEPDLGSDKDCMYGSYYRYDQSKWRAISTNDTSSYVCEWDSKEQGRKNRERIEADNEETGYLNPIDPVLTYKSRRYMILEGEATWEEANERCESLGGHLAVINNKKENKALYKYMIERGYESVNFGYTDQKEEGKWVWAEGYESDYTNWGKNQPDNFQGDEDYAAFYADAKYKWNDSIWSGVYFCEWEK